MSEPPNDRLQKGLSRAPPPPVAPGARDGIYTIGDLAREFDISTRAIRFYEARGLIAPERRGISRMFGQKDRQRLAVIVRAKNLGLTLEEIGEHLALLDATAADDHDLADLKRRAERHLNALNTKRSDLVTTLKDLRRIRAEIGARLARRKAMRT